MTTWFHAITDPVGVAVIGASDDPRKISGRAVDYLRRFGFAGKIYPVNARRSTVQGLTSYPSMGEIGAPVDLAVVCVPADGVTQALEECEAAGVSAAIVFSSGFGEAGAAGAERQARLDAFLERSRLRVLGPNSLGVLTAERHVIATFTSALDSMTPRAGNIVIVSQSGAFGSFILSSAHALELGIRHFISTGNESDIDVAEALDAVVRDPCVDVALVYVEGLRDGPAFRSAARVAAEHGTRVIAMKVGVSSAGAQAASLHTGALAGADRAYDCAMAEDGIVRVPTIEAMLDAAQIAATDRVAAGTGLSVVTISGGGGIMMADTAAAHGVQLASWTSGWRERMTDLIPAYGSAANPIDVTAELIYRPDLLEGVLTLCAQHPETDMIAVLLGNVAGQEDELVDVLEKAHRASGKPLAVSWVGGSGLAIGKLRDRGIPAYPDPARAVSALAAARPRIPLEPTWDRAAPVDPERAAAARDLITGASAGTCGLLDEVSTKRVLSLYGVPVPAEQQVETADDAVRAAAELGGPVAVKLVSAVVTHKEKVGGVRLGLHGDADVRDAATEILRRATEAGVADARLVVQAMARPGLELFVGAHVDPCFGPMVVVGAGGTGVEILDDSVMASAPVSADRADGLLRSLRHAPMLDDWRGRGPRDVAAIAETVVSVSELVADVASLVTQIDVNPVLVGDRDAGVVAVDGLILTGSDTTGSEST